MLEHKEPMLVESHNCPVCHKYVTPYGQVNVPPIWKQLADNQNGIKREWLSERHCCYDCECLFDVVIINNVEVS